MEIIYDIYNTKIKDECHATIGVFDGVHAGHQAIIKQMMTLVDFCHRKSMVITFDKFPIKAFMPEFQPQLLTTLNEKIQLIEQLGVDYLVVLPFTKEMGMLTAREFMEQILKDRLNVKMLYTGYDNRFGRGREEGYDDYVRYGKELGIKVVEGIELQYKGYEDPVCSTVIRQMIEKGDVHHAAAMLTRNYQLSGTVTQGEHIGTGLGFPTANLQPDDAEKMIPLPGVYIVWASIDGGERMQAMMNIGTRPTFNGHQTTLEVNILDFDGDLYGKRLTVGFIVRLRDEEHFESAESLVAQLEKDKEITRNVFKEIEKTK